MQLTNNKRGKAKYDIQHTVRSNYKEFKKEHPEVSYKQYMAVYEDFIYAIVHKIIEESADFRVPQRLGDIGIRKTKIKKELQPDGTVKSLNRPVNFKATIELWERLYGTTDKKELKKIEDKPLVRFNNNHTGHYTFFICWDKRTCNVKNQSRYKFLPCRKFKRMIKEITAEKTIDYYESEW